MEKPGTIRILLVSTLLAIASGAGARTSRDDVYIVGSSTGCDGIVNANAIVIVTHSMQQAARVWTGVAYFHRGLLVEVDDTDKVFTVPQHKPTEDYITGRIG